MKQAETIEQQEAKQEVPPAFDARFPSLHHLQEHTQRCRVAALDAILGENPFDLDPGDWDALLAATDCQTKAQAWRQGKGGSAGNPLDFDFRDELEGAAEAERAEARQGATARARLHLDAGDLTEAQRELEAVAGADTEGPRILSWAQVQALPGLSWTVDGLLSASGVSLMVGHPKAGKSTLARVLAAEVMGYGRGSFLGRAVVERGRVAYYSPDEAPQMVREHFVGILPRNADGLDFVERADMDSLARIVKDGGHKLLIVDTLGRLFAGSKFPDSDQYMAWQQGLDRVRRVATDTECHVCLLHHARKSGGDRSLAVLGSAAIAGSADTVIELQVEERDGRWARTIQSTQRAGVELPRQKLVFAGDGWLGVEPLGLAQDVAAKAEAMAEVRAMRADGKSFAQIAETMGISKNMAFRWAR